MAFSGRHSFQRYPHRTFEKCVCARLQSETLNQGLFLHKRNPMQTADATAEVLAIGHHVTPPRQLPSRLAAPVWCCAVSSCLPRRVSACGYRLAVHLSYISTYFVTFFMPFTLTTPLVSFLSLEYGRDLPMLQNQRAQDCQLHTILTPRTSPSPTP